MVGGAFRALQAAVVLAPRLLGLAGRLGALVVATHWHRRRALGGFRRGLLRAGVPEHVAEALGSAYPDLLALGREARRHGRHGA